MIDMTALGKLQALALALLQVSKPIIEQIRPRPRVSTTPNPKVDPSTSLRIIGRVHLVVPL